jgi:YfiH family protein
MLILQPYIFKKFDNLVFGFSTKLGDNNESPYDFNLSLSVGDEKDRVLKNRNKFFDATGLSVDEAAFQKQVHGDTVSYINNPGIIGESDAMITDKPGIGLCISTADCTPVFIYEYRRDIIAAVHSGWKGTQKKIAEKTVKKLKNEYNCDPENMFVYLGPSISQQHYQVGEEVSEYFDNKYLRKDNDKLLLDLASVNYDMLIAEGIPSYQIQKSHLCSFEYNEVLHSYRKNGKNSGRALGIIAMRVLKNE